MRLLMLGLDAAGKTSTPLSLLEIMTFVLMSHVLHSNSLQTQTEPIRHDYTYWYASRYISIMFPLLIH